MWGAARTMGIGAGRALGWTGTGAAIGAAAGGMYGMLSRDTSVLGGAFRGGMWGAGIGTGGAFVNAARPMLLSQRANISRPFSMAAGTRGAALSAIQFGMAGAGAARYIGRGITNTKTYGKIRGMFP